MHTQIMQLQSLLTEKEFQHFIIWSLWQVVMILSVQNMQLMAQENYLKILLKLLKQRKACLIGNHGQIAFSENLSKAFELAEEVENLSNQYIKALKIGKPKILSSKEMSKVLSKAKNYKRG